MPGVLSKKGINAQRRQLSDKTNRDDEHLDLVSASTPRVFQRAIVVDVIYDPISQAQELSSRYAPIDGASQLLNSGLLSTAPRNSLIARVVSGGVDRRSQTPSIFFPALSFTHEPIKPGEYVWVFYEDPENSLDHGFWLSRIKEPVDIDDPNFTHGDRKFVGDEQPDTFDRLQQGRALENLDAATQARLRASSGKGPGFPNGGGTEEAFTLNEIDAFETIEQQAIANRVSSREPVPRYSKRPNDWAAEGSNNSLLVLGEDRTGGASKLGGDGNVVGRPDADLFGNSGMFDVVTGRGLGRQRKLASPGSVPQDTSPAVVKNARGLLETDKDPAHAPVREGDPDFINDATRIYGAMNTDLDKNFNITGNIPVLNGGTKPIEVRTGPAGVLKSNNIRLIAREDGTIRIIKEGVQDDEGGKGRAVIMIEPDGTIMVDGPHIILGSGIKKDNGKGTQVYVGRDAQEPLVLGNVLKTLLNAYTSAMQKEIDKFVASLNTLASTVSAPPGVLGNFGIPLPGMVAIGTTLSSAGPALQAGVDAATQDLQSKIDTMLSTVGKTL